ncbi:MAG: hypothetical protein E7306_06545 [Butyrivibrio sp.]|nr:hypothetical protein [Butyrivibrio sp.]
MPDTVLKIGILSESFFLLAISILLLYK